MADQKLAWRRSWAATAIPREALILAQPFQACALLASIPSLMGQTIGVEMPVVLHELMFEASGQRGGLGPLSHPCFPVLVLATQAKNQFPWEKKACKASSLSHPRQNVSPLSYCIHPGPASSMGQKWDSDGEWVMRKVRPGVSQSSPPPPGQLV